MSREEAGARATYDAFAASFDDFNTRYDYRLWTGSLLAVAEEAGLGGDRLLDVGCGTGLSMVVPLERGMSATGCDISPAMLAEARAKLGGRARLVESDMRRLPSLGEFDLVWSLNDAANYLMDAEELTAALRGMRRNLAPGGLVVFDLNTVAAYRTFWSERLVVEGTEGRRYVWNGLAREVRPGGIFEARFEGEGEGVKPHRHRQRHFPVAEAPVAIAAAGLRIVTVLGEHLAELSEGVDEDFHTKAVYVARASDSQPA